MIVKIENSLYEFEVLNIYNGKILIDGKYYSTKNVFLITDDNELSVGSLYSQLEKINKKYKLAEYVIAVSEDYSNMEVAVNHTGKDIHEIRIVIGVNFINDFSEEELLIYIAHEVGHVLDFKFTLRKNKYLNLIKFICCFLSIVVVPIMYYIYFGLNEFYQIKIFSIMMLLLVIYKTTIDKYFKAFFSRKQEYNADSNAVRIVGDVTKVIKALIALQYVLGSFDPKSSIFSTHPSLSQRISYLRTKYFYHYIWRFFLLK
jgi:hypothetical protein